MNPAVRLIEEKDLKGYFVAVVEINGIEFLSNCVKTKEQWEKNFNIKTP